jgi:hypothetical protein
MVPAGDEVGLMAYHADVSAMYVTFAEQVQPSETY